jgi:L-lactate utilization protein LutC
MTTGRDAFLQRVRQAVRDGNRAGPAPPHPSRGTVGYQGAGPDSVVSFREAFTAAGGQAHLVPDREAAAACVLELVQARTPRRVLIGPSPVLDPLGLPERLRRLGIEVIESDRLPEGDAREPLFAADLGISGVAHLVAETGTLVLAARPGEPRSLSLLPPVLTCSTCSPPTSGASSRLCRLAWPCSPVRARPATSSCAWSPECTDRARSMPCSSVDS